MPTDLFDRYKVVDVDSHLTEPPDTWTARFPASRHDDVPHVERIDGQDVWMAGGDRLGRAGLLLHGRPRRRHARVDPGDTFDDIHPAMYDPQARLAFLDAEGIDAQILYPNVGGFGNAHFLRLGDQDLVMECVRGVQRLPHRLVQRRARPARRRSPRCRSGTSTSPSRRCSAASATATGRSTSATSQPTTACRRSRTRTGTRSGRLHRRPTSRSASTWVAARWARSSSTPQRWGG